MEMTDKVLAAFWMIGNMDTKEDCAQWWGDHGETWNEMFKDTETTHKAQQIANEMVRKKWISDPRNPGYQGRYDSSAEHSGRVRVTIKHYYEVIAPTIGPITAWRFDAESEVFGLDPWKSVEVDKAINGSGYFLHWNCENVYSGDDHVFVQIKDLGDLK